MALNYDTYFSESKGVQGLKPTMVHCPASGCGIVCKIASRGYPTLQRRVFPIHIVNIISKTCKTCFETSVYIYESFTYFVDPSDIENRSSEVKSRPDWYVEVLMQQQQFTAVNHLIERDNAVYICGYQLWVVNPAIAT